MLHAGNSFPLLWYAQPSQDVTISFHFLYFLRFSVNPVFRKLVASCRLFVAAVDGEEQGDVYAMNRDRVFGKISLKVSGWVSLFKALLR